MSFPKINVELDKNNSEINDTKREKKVAKSGLKKQQQSPNSKKKHRKHSSFKNNPISEHKPKKIIIINSKGSIKKETITN